MLEVITHPANSRKFQVRHDETGGSLTVLHKEGDLVENSVGHILALPLQHLPYWTPKQALENPTFSDAMNLAEKWKDVPFKGDILLNIGGSSLGRSFERLFSKGIKNKPDLFTRTLIGAPTTLIFWLEGKLARHNYFNPFNNEAVIYNPHSGFAMHEMGRAQYFDEKKYRSYVWMFGNIGGLFLSTFMGGLIRSFIDWKASANAMKQYKTDEERMEGLTIMEPKFVGNLLNTVTPIGLNLLSVPLGSALRMPVLPKVIGMGIGHLTSRFIHSKERFGYVFQGKTPSQPEQVRYAVAKAVSS